MTPTEPGYYWAKLITPTSMAECEDWVSLTWEIVQVNDNNGDGDEKFSVQVFGVPVTQWPANFEWGDQLMVVIP